MRNISSQLLLPASYSYSYRNIQHIHINVWQMILKQEYIMLQILIDYTALRLLICV